MSSICLASQKRTGVFTQHRFHAAPLSCCTVCRKEGGRTTINVSALLKNIYTLLSSAPSEQERAHPPDAAHAAQAPQQTVHTLSDERESRRATKNAQLIIARLLGIPPEKQLMTPEKKIDDTTASHVLAAAKQCSKGYPLPYILQSHFFYQRDFYVDERVLIPRLETEKLVELCIAHARTKTLKRLINPLILDCGCGSGCIGISLAAELSKDDWQVAFSDIDADALAVCRQNAKAILGSAADKLELYQDDLIQRLVMEQEAHAVRAGQAAQQNPASPQPLNMKSTPPKSLHFPLSKALRPGIIVANLPYLTPKQAKRPELSSEPSQALSDGSHSGLASILRLIAMGSTLNYPHLLMLEYDPVQLDSIIRALAMSSYCCLQSHIDCFGYPRFLSCNNFLHFV